MQPLKLFVLMALVMVIVVVDIVIWFICLHSKTFTHFQQMNQQTWCL
jgi:hypothetical protein